MKKEDIKFGDWSRVFMGEVPAEFLIEVMIRTFLIFIMLHLSMRLMGKRMGGQLNRIEMIALFSLAAAIGIPLQSPDRGLLPAVVVAIVVVFLSRFIARMAFKSPSFEKLVHGNYATLIEDGVINWKKMKNTRLSMERLFARLRSDSVMHLGQVKRLYFESNGKFTLILNEEPVPGLSVLPPADDEFLRLQKRTDDQVCTTCGKRRCAQEETCSNCQQKEWIRAFN